MSEKEQAGGAESSQAAGPQAARQALQIDSSHAVANYTNFCRVTSTPEELIIDLGLNAQPQGANNDPIMIDQRLIMNYYTAKRMLGALHMAVQRHEATFGEIELDVTKRIQKT